MKVNVKKSVLIFLLAALLLSSFIGCELFENEESSSRSEGSGSTIDVVSETESGDNSENVSEEQSEEASEAAKDTVVSFLACPDNIIHPSVFYDAINRAAEKNGTSPKYTDLANADYDFFPIYEFVKDAIEKADVSYINQETLVGGTAGSISGYPRFNSPDAIAYTDIALGFDVVNVAHNHMLDSSTGAYLKNCAELFDREGLTVIGYYPDSDSTNIIPIVESKGIKIAFLAYTYGTNGIKLQGNSSIVIPYLDRNLVTKQVKLAKEQADFVIVSCHWGNEDSFNADSQQKEYSTLMTELGVDVVLGMHPHVIQPMEMRENADGHKTLVVYSLGNFVSGMVSGKNMLAGMLSLDIIKDGETGEIYMDAVQFIPTVTHYEKKDKVASNDTGYRNFKIYYLDDYTEDLAAKHGVVNYEHSHDSTLVGGKFSLANLYNTLYKYIPEEFLPEEVKKAA